MDHAVSHNPEDFRVATALSEESLTYDATQAGVTSPYFEKSTSYHCRFFGSDNTAYSHQ
jgi:hypothetical protein